MDIPDTGAVFTLGKSYLSSEDNHSYFFIKHDAVKTIVAGSYQSAVICESGRLFVWGKNDDGQLGIPNNSQLHQQATVTRPSCVKAYKSNGIKILSIAFGDKFSVTISVDNRVHVCGKQIGIEHSDWKPNEIVEFKTLADDNLLNFIDVQAGNDFFVVLTNCGKAYGYGSNEFNQISKSSDTAMFTDSPVQIAITEQIKQIACHDTKSLYVTDTNEIYVFNRTIANRIEFDDDIIEYLNYNRNNNYVYLICESGSYLCELTAKVKADDFRKLHLFDVADDEDPEGNQIQMITFGDGNSLSFTTKSGRFFTNYDRKVRGDEFHEIKKFLNMRIINVSSGANHTLAHALPNAKPLGKIKEEMDVRMEVSRSKRSIVPMPVIAQIPKNEHDDKMNEESNEKKIDENINKTEENTTDEADNKIKSPVKKSESPEKKTDDEVQQPEIENQKETLITEHNENEGKITKVVTGAAITTLAAGSVAAPIIATAKDNHEDKAAIETKPETNENMKQEKEVDENHNHIPSLDNNHLEVPEKHSAEDPTSISETDSVSDLSFPGSECTVKFRDNPETINSADTNAGSTELEQQISADDMRSINNAINLVRVKTFAETKLNESRPDTVSPTAVDNSGIKIIDTKKNEIYNVIQSRDGQLKQIELVQSRRQSNEDERKSATGSHDIRFIDNGIDVTDDIKKIEEKKVSARLLRLKNSKVAPAEEISPHHMEDELLGEKMGMFQMREVRDSKFETQVKLREQFESPGAGPPKPRKPKTPMPIKSRHFGSSEHNTDDDEEDDDDADCRTTASAASTKDTKHSSKKHSISNTSFPAVTNIKKSQDAHDDPHHPDLDQNDNKVKKFFRNIKDSSCRQIDSIRSADCMNPACDCMKPAHDDHTTEANINQIQSTQKNSKVCNIL